MVEMQGGKGGRRGGSRRRRRRRKWRDKSKWTKKRRF